MISPAATTTVVQPQSDHPTAAPAPVPAASDTASPIPPDTAPSASPAATTTDVQPQIDPPSKWTTQPTQKGKRTVYY